MRLPWLQIDEDGVTRGEMLGRLLGIGPHAGVGLAMSVWKWALEMAADGDFSGGPHDVVALGAGVGCDDPRLADELSRCGLAVVTSGAGLVPVSLKQVRICGLDRYRRAWEKNNRRKPARLVPVTGTFPAQTGAEPAKTGAQDEDEDEDVDKKKKTTGSAKKPRTRDPRLGPLIGRLKAAFESAIGAKYTPSDADVAMLAGLLGRGTDDEIVERWLRGLKATQFEAKCATFAQLALRWNEIAVVRSADRRPQGSASFTGTGPLTATEGTL